MLLSLSSLGAVILLGALGWFLLRPDSGAQSGTQDRAQIESNEEPGDGIGRVGDSERDGRAGATDGSDSDLSTTERPGERRSGDLSPTDPSGNERRDAGSDLADGQRTGAGTGSRTTNGASDLREETDISGGTSQSDPAGDAGSGSSQTEQQAQSDPSDAGADDRRNSEANSDDNVSVRTGTDRAATPFRQQYSISTFPGFAFIRVDGELINEDGIIPVYATLREGTHTFQLTRSNGEDLGTLQYTVARDDPNRVLVLKFEDRIVEARVE